MVQQVKQMDSNKILQSAIPHRYQQNLTILDLHVHTCVWCVQHVLVGTCGELLIQSYMYVHTGIAHSVMKPSQ